MDRQILSNSGTSRVCVIGSNGGIGSRFLKLLSFQQDVDVVCVDKDVKPATEHCAEYFSIDLTACLDDAVLRERLSQIMKVCDGVVLLAGAVHDRDIGLDAYTQLNVEVPKMLLNDYGRSRNTPGRFLFASTIAVYGDRAGRATTESDEICPTTPYARSKAAGEQALTSTAEKFDNVSLTVLRLATLINRNDRGNLIRLINTGRQFRILPRVRRSILKAFVDIEDVCEVMRVALFAEMTRTGVFNVVGPPIHLQTILDSVHLAVGRCFRPLLPSWALTLISPTMARPVFVSNSRAENTFGVAFASFEDAFRREFLDTGDHS